jgi:hypothetical protein
MNSKVEVFRSDDFRPSSLISIIPQIHSESKKPNTSEAPDESTHLLQENVEDKTPTFRTSSKFKKDKEMIPASKLASDATLRGKVLRPAHIFSHFPRESVEENSSEPDISWTLDDGSLSTKEPSSPQINQ